MTDPADAFVHDDPVVDAALDWFARLRNVEPDQETLQAFRDWLEQNPRHEEEFLALEATWGSTAFLSAVRSLDRQAAINGASASRRSIWGWRTSFGAIAASVLVAAGIWQAPGIMIAWQSDYSTATGAQSEVSLPDGSRMILNTASAVAIDFENGRRNIRLLKGEAFFDVVHDVSHPFRVAGTYGEVEVKGTAFSVRTDSEHTNVVLERGLVEVTCLCEAGGGVQLRPGQSVSASANSLSDVSSVDTLRSLAWKDGRISFDNVQMAEVLGEISRYYSGRIFVADSRVGRLVVSGNYRLDNIEGAIRTLADAAGVEMTRLPGGFIILR